jgi:hypothetical protein
VKHFPTNFIWPILSEKKKPKPEKKKFQTTTFSTKLLYEMFANRIEQQIKYHEHMKHQNKGDLFQRCKAGSKFEN